MSSIPPTHTPLLPHLAQGFGGHYDVILTSEGIYNQDSQWRLLECIKQVWGVRTVTVQGVQGCA